ncbi:hypothetical protein niasHT_006276 [Heterodera trifolii]|uniref:AAA ATPase AAA+ lid domain-containing protein n=1 Tax=Heterodera trifolii TaxID=157864 RepID=A0ABD2M4L0_9BILA
MYSPQLSSAIVVRKSTVRNCRPQLSSAIVVRNCPVRNCRQIAISTENYSFSDLWALCTEAAFCPIQNAWQNDLLLRHTTPNNLRQVNALDFKCAMRKVRPAAINAENRKELVEFAEKYAQKNSDNE